jgi:circadian clock protein KaiB
MNWSEPSAPPHFILRLFVTGTTSRSRKAITSITEICEHELAGRYDLEVIDVYQDPEATRELQVIATPTLVKLTPDPVRRVVGDLSDRTKVLAALNITAIVAERSIG